MEKENKSFSILHTKLKASHIFLILVLVVIMFMMFGGSDSTSNTKTSSPTSSDYAVASYVQAKNFVSSVLKSPSTADFPFFGEGVKVGTNTYKVSSYVDSQNGFGAMIRSNYIITLKFNGGNEANQSNWQVVEFIFDGEEIVSNSSQQDYPRIKNCMDKGNTEDYCINLIKAFGN